MTVILEGTPNLLWDESCSNSTFFSSRCSGSPNTPFRRGPVHVLVHIITGPVSLCVLKTTPTRIFPLEPQGRVLRGPLSPVTPVVTSSLFRRCIPRPDQKLVLCRTTVVFVVLVRV